jgi:hypothetical protein
MYRKEKNGIRDRLAKKLCIWKEGERKGGIKRLTKVQNVERKKITSVNISKANNMPAWII